MCNPPCQTSSRDRLAVSVTVRHYKPLCFSDKISLDPSLSSEMSLGLVEIECPYSLRNTDSLIDENGVLSLKKNTCLLLSMQLAITGLRWCDFVVWTSVGVTIRSNRYVCISTKNSGFQWEKTSNLLPRCVFTIVFWNEVTS